jgi:hypothetical protein
MPSGVTFTHVNHNDTVRGYTESPLTMKALARVHGHSDDDADEHGPPPPPNITGQSIFVSPPVGRSAPAPHVGPPPSR